MSDERFRIDNRRRWMVSEYRPDAGDGSPGTFLREPTDEEWAALAAPGDEALRKACEQLAALAEVAPQLEAAARAIAATRRVGEHSNACSVVRKKASIDRCDCWIIRNARTDAGVALAAALAPRDPA